jgi:hypothetical protein
MSVYTNTKPRGLMGRLRREECGMAMATVLLLGMALMALTAVVATRSLRQAGNVGSDLRWEQALMVAEAGLDTALIRVYENKSYNTGETVPEYFSSTEAERDWAVAAAEEHPEEDVEAALEGEYVIVRPANASVVYVVGYSPARAETTRRTRVVRVDYGPRPETVIWEQERSILVGGDLDMGGNPVFKGDLADAHTNADLNMTGNPTFQDSCISATGDAGIIGNLVEPVYCDDRYPEYYQETVPIPDFTPRDMWFMSEYDMCPDGTVRAGPAHAVHGGTAGAEPCTGLALATLVEGQSFQGWVYDECCDALEGAKWSYPGNTTNDGAYYFYQGTVRVPGNVGTQTSPFRVLLMIEAEGSCPNHVGGDFIQSGNVVLAPYTAGTVHADNHIIVIAGRDIDWVGNGRREEPGAVLAVEQISISGNPQIYGSFVARDACDSADGAIHESWIVGNPVFELDGIPMTTIWYVETMTGIGIDHWDEI